ncbi:MAG: hypothetical protein ABFE01_29845 [Phycisphaerales bacterium]|jgi:hypothetical protein
MPTGGGVIASTAKREIMGTDGEEEGYPLIGRSPVFFLLVSDFA